MTQKKLLIVNLVLVITIIMCFLLKTNIYAAVWEAPYPLSTSFELIGDVEYDYNPSTNRVTMTYRYKNITGSTINNPQVVNLFLWSNDICSTSWGTTSYDGSGYFSNLVQGATVISPDGYFNWHSLITSPTPPMDSNGIFPSLPTQSTQVDVSYPSWNICTGTAGEWADQEIATFSTSWTVSNAYWVQSLSLIVSCVGVDCPAFPDFDDDGDSFTDCNDNCPVQYNPFQLDTRPDVPNNCGDACECEADLNGDGKVEGLDTIIYKAGYPRSYYLGVPCAVCIGGSNAGVKCLSDAECPGGDCGQNPNNPCINDLNCDMEVGGLDTILYKDDYPRTEYLGVPCPPCSRVNFPCSYPEP